MSSVSRFRWAIVILAALFAFDFAFMGLHVLFKLSTRADIPSISGFTDLNLDIEREYGYGEWYQHVKELAIVVLFVGLFLLRRQSVELAWVAVSAYLLVDDTLMVHERLGRWSEATFQFPEVWYAPHIGEVVPAALFGLLLYGLVCVTYFRSDAASRQLSHRLIILVTALGFLGVIVDQVTAPTRGYLGGFCVLIEDGGEMLVLSLMLYIALVALILNAERSRTGVDASPVAVEAAGH